MNKHSHFGLLKKIVSIGIALCCSTSALLPLPAQAATTINAEASARVSLTFDDSYQSAVTQAAPTLAKYGMSGTSYVITGCVDMTVVPNSCRANEDGIYLTWAQISQLQTSYKWEIGSHTVSHPLLASSDSSIGQPNPLTAEQVRQELVNSKAALAAHGINAQAFSAPYGDYDTPVLAQIAKEYSTMRGFADTGYNVWPYNEYLVRVQQVQAGVSVATVKSYIDSAIANKQWLVLVFHDIKPTPSSNPDDYQYSTSNLDQIAAYIKSKNVPVITPSQAGVQSDTNLLANGSFNSGISNGWSTNLAANVTLDTGRNGSYPDPTNAIKFTATSQAARLYSPRVTVNPNNTYLLKSFLHVKQISSGEMGYYIDEYDRLGNFVSGQYKKAETSDFAENINFAYKPSTTSVAQARLQIFTTANSGITAYVDNFQWFPLTNLPAPPDPTNLLPNGTFDAGISGGWHTDNTSTFQADSSNNGSPANPAKSVKVTATTTNTHLFSPTIAVDGTKIYSLSNYLNIKQVGSSGVGYYIDEYNSSGSWISGQYKTDVRVIGAGNVSFAYKPSSTNVKQARLQIISIHGSGLLAYLDDATWIVQ